MAPAIFPHRIILDRPIFAEASEGMDKMPSATPEELTQAPRYTSVAVPYVTGGPWRFSGRNFPVLISLIGISHLPAFWPAAVARASPFNG